MTTRHDLSRRGLLKAAAASAGAIAFPTIVPASALGRDEKAAPSDRVVVGCIGTGGRGRGLIGMFMGQPDVQLAAVCDVDASHRAQGKQEVDERAGNADCASYHDFRELLARDDVEAVIVATPDHWHGIASVAAAEAGKDIYCEKPLTNTVAEGRAIVDAVERHGRILQVGSHERSGDNARYACELVRNGRIGRIRSVRINLPDTDSHHEEAKAHAGAAAPEAIPEGFDYDFWLGHTPRVPYLEDRCHFWWRFQLAYGGGEMTDRGAHVIDIAQLGLGADHTGPVHVEARGRRGEGLYDAFWDYEFTNTYADGVTLIGSTQGPRGLKFEGEDGWIFVEIHGGRLEASSPSLLEEPIGPDEIHLGRSPGHQRNFLDCVRSRTRPVAPAEAGHRTATICHLNNIAMLVGTPLAWDPEAEQVTNCEEANRLLSPAMRKPWRL
ncbi:Gfo/Idh/MocA family protein [Tautonia plasticadhaerens]|uniref:Inositol 2-dehydrogenase n=1 Tax=Tautonia plasticadhaerens TaxID=2527974 RepID=A0A518HC63_9BACT|nr:Gfo/Idh/MocA family oxidoreductase [Tautonia plasticadhaerens]QDV38440.1 Inositol 2-dehydrogenase [Tautonia plasticadhaerens]